jgi:hypothetical protein
MFSTVLPLVKTVLFLIKPYKKIRQPWLSFQRLFKLSKGKRSQLAPEVDTLLDKWKKLCRSSRITNLLIIVTTKKSAPFIQNVNVRNWLNWVIRKWLTLMFIVSEELSLRTNSKVNKEYNSHTSDFSSVNVYMLKKLWNTIILDRSIPHDAPCLREVREWWIIHLC